MRGSGWPDRADVGELGAALGEEERRRDLARGPGRTTRCRVARQRAVTPIVLVGWSDLRGASVGEHLAARHEAAVVRGEKRGDRRRLRRFTEPTEHRRGAERASRVASRAPEAVATPSRAWTTARSRHASTTRSSSLGTPSRRRSHRSANGGADHARAIDRAIARSAAS